MRRFFLYAVILLLSVWAGVKIAQDPGYLLLAYRKTTIEMPLWFAAVCFALLFFVTYFFVRLWRNLWNTPYRWQLSRLRRISKKLQNSSNAGFLALTTGNWNEARRNLLRAANYAKTAWPYYLGAAFAAHQSQNFELRDAYLQKAADESPQTKIAVGVLQSKFQFTKNPVQTIAILEHLHQIAPKQPYVTRLLAQAYEQLGDWHKLFNLLPTLQKYKSFKPEELVKIQIMAYRGLIHSVEYNDANNLQAVWKKIPKDLRQQPDLISAYAHSLLAKGATTEAETELREALTKKWDDSLILLYGNILSPKPDQQLLVAEKWLPQHKNDATLLYVLGHLSVRNHLWGKAKSYFEASITVEPRQETYFELGQLLEQLGEGPTQVINCYKTGLHKTTKTNFPVTV